MSGLVHSARNSRHFWRKSALNVLADVRYYRISLTQSPKRVRKSLSQRLVVVAFVLTLAIISSRAGASTTCQDTIDGQLCTSQVQFAAFAQQAYQPQQQDQWCWAASIAMVFAFYQHPVSQSRIVTEVYGSAVDMPAQAGIVMAQQLNRNWVDDFGIPFSARLTGAYDYMAGVYDVTNDQLIAELDQEHPIVIGNTHHAMVMTEIQYYKTASGPIVVAGGVFDPWPGIGARALTAAELVPAGSGGELMFVATVRVATISASGSSSASSGGKGNIDLLSVFALLSFLVIRIVGRTSMHRCPRAS